MKNGVLVLLAALLSVACSDDGGLLAVDAEPAPTWANFADGFFTTYCHDCHGPGDLLRDYSLLAAVVAEQDKIRCGVSPTALTGCTISPGMFPIGNGAQPSDAERERLVRWIDEGAVQ